jgi:signal transduction histidine kinase
VARRAREVAEAELVVVLLHDQEQAALTVAALDADEPLDGLLGAVLPVAGSMLETALDNQRQIVLEHVGKAAPWPVPLPWLRASIAPFGGARGVLVVAYPGQARDAEELTLLSLFAGQAAVALDREAARVDREELLVLSDRERIARDLHDVVIQRLFATGLRLQTAATMVTRPEVASRINQAVDDLDATIRDIRGAIFELRSPATDSVRAQIRALVDRTAQPLGFRPVLRIDGPIDSVVSRELAGDLTAVLGEALSNVIRHAGADRVEVSITAGGDQLSLIVADDGRGGAHERSGLANLRQRAEKHGGTFTLETPQGEGTRLEWVVPLG